MRLRLHRVDDIPFDPGTSSGLPAALVTTAPTAETRDPPFGAAGRIVAVGLRCRADLGDLPTGGAHVLRTYSVPGTVLATIPGMPIYAADVSAAAEAIAALTAVGVVATWALRTSKTAVSWVRRRRHKELVTVLSTEVVTGPGWAATASDPEVSLEAGIAYAREAARGGHPPHVPTRGPTVPWMVRPGSLQCPPPVEGKERSPSR